MDVKDLPAIETLLPHRKPMLLVERVLEIDENHIRTSSFVEESWPLCSKEGAEMILAVEIIAQSAAALSHLRKKHPAEPQIDFLVGIKDARFYEEILPLHGELTADVRMVSAIGNYGIFRGDLKYGAEILCEAIVHGLEPEEELWESIMSSRGGVITDG